MDMTRVFEEKFSDLQTFIEEAYNELDSQLQKTIDDLNDVIDSLESEIKSLEEKISELEEELQESVEGNHLEADFSSATEGDR